MGCYSFYGGLWVGEGEVRWVGGGGVKGYMMRICACKEGGGRAARGGEEKG